MFRRCFAALCLLLSSSFGIAQVGPSGPLKPYISVFDPVVALVHVEVIDGTGSAPLPDQTVLLDHGKIASIAPSSNAQIPSGAKVLDLHGHTVYPGLIGMHEHLFYSELGGTTFGEMIESGPPLYLAAGITTARTTGSIEPYTDLNIKHAIDAGFIPGPDLDVTGPYLEGAGSFIHQLHPLSSAADATNTVNYWASEGVTSFKAYNFITPEELKASIEAAHAHGLKITGHLCSIGFTEAANMGIDNLEHGIFVDTEFYSGKKPGICPMPERMAVQEMADKLDMAGPEVMAMIRDLVAHHVAVTSTLSIFESFVPNRTPMEFLEREKDSMIPEAGPAYWKRVPRLPSRRTNLPSRRRSKRKCSLKESSSLPVGC
jgi:imidazolonepropionase-like amidohydrolase